MIRSGPLMYAAALAAALAGWAPRALAQDPVPAPGPEPVEPAPEPELRVASLVIRGIEAIVPPTVLPRRLPLEPGVPYTAERVQATELILLEALAERGHPYAEVEISAEVDPVAGAAAIAMDVDPGPAVVFGEVSIDAQVPIHPDVVLERVTYAPGEPFRPSALRETEAMLLDLPVVAGAAAVPLGIEDRLTVIPTVVRVAPVPRVRGFDWGGSVSSVRCLELGGYWRDRYFMRGPGLLSVGAVASNILARQLDNRFPCTSAGEGPYARLNYLVEADLRQPLPGSPRTVLRGQLFGRRESAPQAYVLEGFGGQAAVLRMIGRDIFGSLSWAPQRNSVDAADFYFCANFGACSPAEIDLLARARWIAPIELTARWFPVGALEPLVSGPGARQEAELYPGLLGPLWRPWLRVGLAGAGRATASQVTYGRFVGEGAVTRRTGLRTEAAARVRLGGLARGEAAPPPNVRFYSGGVNTVRGVGQNLLGPLVLVAAPVQAEQLGCPPVPGGCPPGLVVDPDLVSVRPRGGDAVFEANVEGRVRVSRRVQFAGFVDAGMLFGEVGAPGDVPGDRGWRSAITPGVGTRVVTPIGPLRFDVGYDGRGARTVPFLTRTAEGELIFLGDVVWDPYGWDEPGGLRRFFRRLTVHLGVGQPF